MVWSLLEPFGVFLSVGGIIGLFINAVVTSIAIVIADKVIAHNIEFKHAFIMAIAAFFITPMFITGLMLAGFYIDLSLSLYVLPLLVWIILSELLLQSEVKTKLYVALFAFVVFLVLRDVVGLPAMLYSVIGF
jgi:hypothetical protein